MSSTRPTQLLVLDPEDTLTFQAPFDKKCNTNLELTNPTPYSICYKVKTTASRKYCVKPKVGLMLPYSRQVINFRLKGEKGDNLDKFKILAAVVPSNARGTDPNKIWAFINEANTMQSKMKVAFMDQAESAVHLGLQSLKRSYLRLSITVFIMCIMTGIGFMLYYS